MKVYVKIGLAFAILWILIKLSCFSFKVLLTKLEPFVFLNMLFVTLAVSAVLYIKKRKQREDSNYLDDIKTSMIPGVIYTVVVSVFIYFYYQHIYPEFNTNKISEMEIRMQDKKNIADLRKSNPEMENKSDEEIKSKVLKSVNDYYSAKFTMTITLLGLLVYTTLNSILLSLIFRRVIFRHHLGANSSPNES